MFESHDNCSCDICKNDMAFVSLYASFFKISIFILASNHANVKNDTILVRRYQLLIEIEIRLTNSYFLTLFSTLFFT